MPSLVRQIDLTDRVAVVTGGTSGIGLGIARHLLDAGAHVVLASRTGDLTHLSEAELSDDRVSVVPCDVAQPAQVKKLVRAAVEHSGRLDILVCSHGSYPGVRSFLDLPIEEYDQTMNINARGVLLCAQEAGRVMAPQPDGGRIILISSMNAVLAQVGAVDYDTSKAAVHGMMRAIAVELAPHGVTVNAIAPGWIRTPMSADELTHLAGRVLNPSRTTGEPADIGRAALWLADPANGYVTGSVVCVDGGQTAMLPVPWTEGTELLVS